MAFIPNLKWDDKNEKYYEVGVDRGVVFPKSVSGSYENGAAWNGLVNVTESPEGAEATPLYANNGKYLNLMSNEDFNGSIEAYTYPDAFAVCLGQEELADGLFATQQERKEFGFTYRSLIGNDTQGTKYGYKIHIVYNALAGVSEKSNQTTGEENEPETMSWDFTTTPVSYDGLNKACAHFIIDTTKVKGDEEGAENGQTAAEKIEAIEKILYGTAATTADKNDAVAARMPEISELVSLFTVKAKASA